MIWTNLVSLALCRFPDNLAHSFASLGAYAEEEWVHSYLNRPEIRHQLGVDHEADGGVKEFIGCSEKVGEDFAATGDG